MALFFIPILQLDDRVNKDVIDGVPMSALWTVHFGLIVLYQRMEDLGQKTGFRVTLRKIASLIH
jgi:hypothetical protein